MVYRTTSSHLGFLSNSREIRTSKLITFISINLVSYLSQDVAIGRLSVGEQEAIIVEDLLLCMLVSTNRYDDVKIPIV